MLQEIKRAKLVYNVVDNAFPVSKIRLLLKYRYGSMKVLECGLME